MAVNDHGLEVLKKSGELVNPTSPADMYLKVLEAGARSVPPLADAVSAEYPNSTTEVFKYRQGGLSGTVLRTVTITYTDASKETLSGVVWS